MRMVKYWHWHNPECANAKWYGIHCIQCTLCAVWERVYAAVFHTYIYIYVCVVCRSPHKCSSVVHNSMRRIVFECSLASFLRRRLSVSLSLGMNGIQMNGMEHQSGASKQVKCAFRVLNMTITLPSTTAPAVVTALPPLPSSSSPSPSPPQQKPRTKIHSLFIIRNKTATQTERSRLAVLLAWNSNAFLST